MNAYNKQKYTKINDPYMIKIGTNKREHTDLIIFFTCSTEKFCSAKKLQERITKFKEFIVLWYFQISSNNQQL